MAVQVPAEQGPIESNLAGRTVGERVAALEAILPTLATKADLEKLRTDFESLRSEIKTLQWLIVVAVAVTGIIVQYLNQGGA